jgi:hypothetical protein
MPPEGFPFAAERGLRDGLHQLPGPLLLTGGQTGVDTAAAAAGLRARLSVHVVFPRGFRQENGPITAAGRRALDGAVWHELASPRFAYRTWTCAYLADAVILIDPAGGAGCQETIRAAEHFGRPLLNVGPDKPQASFIQIVRWLKLAGPRVLMIAGCRASLLAPDTAAAVEAQLDAVIAAFAP